MQLLDNSVENSVEAPNAKGWYNGYSWPERDRKFQVMKKLIASCQVKAASGSCRLCNDDQCELEYHDEDYSLPYLWVEPAMYVVCKHCHIHKLHKRFNNPLSWTAFLAHVRRGGFARDLQNPTIKSEVGAFQRALAEETPYSLKPLRAFVPIPGTEWFANLSMNKASLTDRKARPRP